MVFLDQFRCIHIYSFDKVKSGGLLVSVIVPVYNKQDYLLRSIESLLSQSLSNFEILIYDDCSSDNSREIINSFKDPRIKSYFGEVNKGVRFARDFLLSKARGKFISLFDADDLACSYKLEYMTSFLQSNSEIDFVGSKVNYFNEKDKYRYFPFSFESFNDNDIRANLFFCNTFTTSTVVFRRSLIPHINFQDFPFRISEDYYVWAKLSRIFKFANLSQRLTDYRETQTGIMGSTKDIYGDAIKYIHEYQFELLKIYPHKTFIDVHSRYMYSNSLSIFYLKKSVVFYKILFLENTKLKSFDSISFSNQIRMNWLRKCIVFSINNPLLAIRLYYTLFDFHDFRSFTRGFVLFIFSMNSIRKKLFISNEK